jgi:hypothetical protein
LIYAYYFLIGIRFWYFCAVNNKWTIRSCSLHEWIFHDTYDFHNIITKSNT